MIEMMCKHKLWIWTLAFLTIISNSAVNADPMYDAVQEGDIETVKLLIEGGADINAMGMFGHPPLNHAVASGHKDVAEYLISKGADINGQDVDGSTPLQTAAFWAQKEISVVLISSGSKVNSMDNFGLTPLHAAAGGYDSENYSMAVTLATIAAAITYNEEEANKANEIAKLLISNGASVNAKDKNGYTPLHWAAKQGRKGVTEILIANGADVNSRSKGRFFMKGKTPLRLANDEVQGGLAIEENHKEIIELLKRHGAE